MKTKTLISGVLLGCIVGTAFGVPTPEDRKRLCEQNPNEFVWVEKGEGVCIPINPCESHIKEIRNSYCIFTKWYGEDIVYRRYVQNVLHTDVVEEKNIPDEDDIYTAYKLQDGGYIVFESMLPFEKDNSNFSLDWSIYGGCWAYGKDYFKPSTFSDNAGACEDVVSNIQCDDIADFVSTVVNNLCVGSFKENNECHIVCEKKVE